MLNEQSAPTPASEQQEQLFTALQQSFEAHRGEEALDIEHEDLQHFGESLAALEPLPLRRP